MKEREEAAEARNSKTPLTLPAQGLLGLRTAVPIDHFKPSKEHTPSDAPVGIRLGMVDIGEQKANISNLAFLDRKPDFYRLLIYVELRDVEHLHSVMLALEAESHVAAIDRFRDPAAAQTTTEQIS